MEKAVKEEFQEIRSLFRDIGMQFTESNSPNSDNNSAKPIGDLITGVTHFFFS